MKIAVAGVGYVGLITGLCLTEAGHQVICFDIDEKRIAELSKGVPVLYEPGVEELLMRAIKSGRIHFTSKEGEAYENADLIFIAVGTPENKDGSANLVHIEQAIAGIAAHMSGNAVIAIKSTVPVGTNSRMKNLLASLTDKAFSIASNPEFLREGSAIQDMFHADRIILGTEDIKAKLILHELYAPFANPILHTDIRSAEMIKYASNAFLATKISFINEIANICEKVGSNIDHVAEGIGMDRRIGPYFLQAGIGYGGSCFPKDTKALVQVAGEVEHHFELLEAVIKVNNRQQLRLVDKVMEVYQSLKGRYIAILGLTFKPYTDDIRESAAIKIVDELIKEGAHVRVFDPIGMENFKRLNRNVEYCDTVGEAIMGVEAALILTEWQEIRDFPLSSYKENMLNPYVFDGRNCFEPRNCTEAGIYYYSIGRGMDPEEETVLKGEGIKAAII